VIEDCFFVDMDHLSHPPTQLTSIKCENKGKKVEISWKKINLVADASHLLHQNAIKI
jgi:hypothetical protein